MIFNTFVKVKKQVQKEKKKSNEIVNTQETDKSKKSVKIKSENEENNDDDNLEQNKSMGWRTERNGGTENSVPRNGFLCSCPFLRSSVPPFLAPFLPVPSFVRSNLKLYFFSKKLSFFISKKHRFSPVFFNFTCWRVVCRNGTFRSSVPPFLSVPPFFRSGSVPPFFRSWRRS